MKSNFFFSVFATIMFVAVAAWNVGLSSVTEEISDITLANTEVLVIPEYYGSEVNPLAMN